MRLGFRFTESMTGACHFLDTPVEERAIRFTITARAANVTRFLRDKVVDAEGEIDIEGFASSRPALGALVLKLIEDQRLRYDLSFEADDGKAYMLRGEQDVLFIAILDGMTTLPASIYDSAGKEVARAILRFDVKADLKALVSSFRLEASLR